MTILTVDVGNSRTKIAVCEAAAEGLPRCLEFAACENAGSDQLRLLRRAVVQACDRAVVAGSGSQALEALIGDWPGFLPNPVVLTDWQQLGLAVDVDAPERVGMDRLLNAAGLVKLNPSARTAVVDSGTATTVDLIDGQVFRGGAILPGLRLSAIALNQYTAALPLVDTGACRLSDVQMPGRDTVEAIAAGIMLGHVGAIRELVDWLEVESVVLTGGAAKRLAPGIPDAQVVPCLALRAMALFAE